MARLKAGDKRGATLTAAEAERLAEGDADELLRVGGLLQRLELLPRARLAFTQVTQLRPDSAAGHLGLGAIALNLGDTAAANIALSTAAWLAPEDAEVRHMLAQALMAEDRFGDAREQLLQFLSLRPKDANAWVLLVEITERIGDTAKRLSALEGAVGAQPSHRVLVRRLVDALDEAGRPHESVTHLSRYLDQCADPEFELDLGQRLLDQGDPSAAEVLRRASAAPDVSVEVLMLTARAEQAANCHPQAVVVLRRALAKGCRDQALFCGLGLSLKQTGDTAGALDILVQGVMQYRGDEQINAMLLDVQRSTLPTPAPSQGPLTSGEYSSALSGNLETFNVVDLLEFLRMNRRTGTLRMICGRSAAEMHLIEGNLASASYSGGAQLGERLVEAGHLTRAEIGEILAEQTAVPLGRRVVELELVRIDALKELLYGEATEAITEVIGWSEGHFIFQPDQALRETFPPELELNTARIMMDAVRMMDEQAALEA